MKIVGYIRVSSEEQIKNYSLQNQEDKCSKYCKDGGHNLLKIFRDEGKSATTINREGLIDLLEYCRKNKGKVDQCIVYKIDRMSRSTTDYFEIRRRLASYGVTIVSVTEPIDDSPIGEFMETLMAAQAKLDNAIRSERTKDGMTKRLEAGLPTNPVPIGYKYVEIAESKKQPVPDEPRFSYLRQAAIDYSKGIYTLNDIAALLNEKGFKTKNNRKASSQFVSRFLKCEFYNGTIISKARKKKYKGTYKPMFSENEWLRIQSVRLEKAVTARPYKRNNPDFPLRKFIRCRKCKVPLRGAWSKGNGGKYAYYTCQNHGPNIPKKVLEDKFIALLNSIKPTQETLEEFADILRKKYDGKYKELNRHAEVVEREISELKELQQKLVEKNLKGIYTDDVYRSENSRIENLLIEKQILLGDVRVERIDIDTIIAFSNNFITNISQVWIQADLETKQRIQRLIFPKGITFDGERIEPEELCLLFRYLADAKSKNSNLG